MSLHPLFPFLGHLFPFVLLLLLCYFPSPIYAIKCYSDQSHLTAALPASASQCPPESGSCIKSIDWANKIVVRQCQNGNCTFPNLTQNAQGGCVNSSTNTQTYCCCYDDGCNRAPQMANGLAFSIFALVSAIGVFISSFWL